MRRRVLRPTVLTAIGVAMLIGCIPLPGSYRPDNNKPRPEVHIGRERSDKPIRVNHATAERVILVLGEPSMRSADGRIIGYHYRVDVGHTVWPLCNNDFFNDSTYESRMLYLQFRDDGRLRRFKVVKDARALERAWEVNLSAASTTQPM